jgi:hypothetical protein
MLAAVLMPVQAVFCCIDACLLAAVHTGLALSFRRLPTCCCAHRLSFVVQRMMHVSALQCHAKAEVEAAALRARIAELEKTLAAANA